MAKARKVKTFYSNPKFEWGCFRGVATEHQKQAEPTEYQNKSPGCLVGRIYIQPSKKTHC